MTMFALSKKNCLNAIVYHEFVSKLKGITKKMKIIRNTADSIFRTITLIVVYTLVSVSETVFGMSRQKK
ncbi:hypothetical protein BAC7755_53940 [Bacillus sp. MN7755]|uniref:Uncharacterized protein n=2 Tax=Bacillus cereus group TaxID=86661 RepID=A0A2B0WRK9_BACAN|nr:hypothetical protein COJ30_22685 [Bacillus anthracis]